MAISLDKSVANLKLILTKNKNFVNNLNSQNSMLVWFINFNYILVMDRIFIYHWVRLVDLDSDLWIFLGDNINKFLKINFSISILISIINHLLNLSHRKSFSNTLTYLSKLLDPKKSCLILIKDLEQLF